MIDNSSKIGINKFVLNIFLVLFVVIYTGLLLKIVLPEKVLNSKVVVNVIEGTDDNIVKGGEVAGTATASASTTNNNLSLWDYIIKIPSNFFENLLSSLSF